MRSELKKRIALGSAQFGMEYGVANKKGKPSEGEVFCLLKFALEEGVSAIDTAYSYGNSEEIIGRFMSGNDSDFKIVSKIPNLLLEKERDPEKCFALTQERLGRKNIYGYLVHNFENVKTHKDLWSGMRRLREKKLVKRIGFSIYKTEELDYLLGEGIDFDIIQFPYNVLDQRFVPYMAGLKKQGKEVHTRSVFLQGLFFLEPKRIRSDFKSASDAIGKLRGISEKSGIPVDSICLCFALLDRAIDSVIVGVDGIDHLKRDLEAVNDIDKVKDVYEELRSLKFDDEDILLPYKWRKK